MTGSSPRGWIAAPAALAIVLVASAAAAQDEEKQLPSWIPSVGIGFGIQSRDIDGNIDAFLSTGAISSVNLTCQGLPLNQPPPFPQITGVCDVSASDSRASDGGALDFSGQVLGPSLASIPLKPRPYVHGGYAIEFDSRTIAEQGLNPGSFDVNGTEPDIHTRLRANPDSVWYAGGGVALEMPIEFTTVFVKLGAHYMEERMNATGSIDQGIDEDVLHTEATEELKIGGVGPTFGVEAEVWRFGPVGLQFVADVFVTFPISGTDTRFELDQPDSEPIPSCSVNPNVECIEPASFDFDADNIHYLGIAGLRFAWLGY